MSLPERIGPYAIERELGRGGMGIVYAGVHAEVGRRAAIKVLLNESKGEERFWRECEALGQLRHPGIVQVYEAGVHGTHPFLALEFVEGQTLDSALTTGGTWDSRRTAELGLKLCEAMAYVHERGLLHRDLKPENVLLDATGQAKITDFGLVRGVGEGALTKTGVMVGTPSFMPPEQAGGEKQKMGPPSDVYSLGATLFMVLTGQPPFRGDSPYSTIALVFTAPPPRASSLAPGVDPVLDEILLRCLAKQPSERYPNAGALGEALRAYLGGELEAPSRAPRAALLGGIAVMACLLLVIGGLLVKKYSSRRATPSATLVVRSEAEARSAWLEVKREGTSAELRQWCADFQQAAPEMLPKVRRRLAEVSWEELGGGEPEPGKDDLRDLRRFAGVADWLEEHKEYAPQPLVGQAEILVSPWKSSRDAPVLASLTLSRPRDSRENREADPRPLSGERLLLYGHGGAKAGTLEAGFEEVELSGATKEVRIHGAGTSREVMVLLWGGTMFRLEPGRKRRVPLRYEALSDGAPITTGVLPTTSIPLGEQTLAVGESTQDEKLGAFALYDRGLPERPLQLQQTPALIRSVAASRDRQRVFMTGGGAKALAGDWFVSEYRHGPRGLEHVGSHAAQAAGLELVLSPQEDRLFVGLNRGGGALYLTDELGRPPLILGPTASDSKEETAAGVAIQAMGVAFLEHGVLVSYDFTTKDEEGAGWLAFYPKDRVDAAAIRGAADRPGQPAQPLWRRDLPGRPRRVALSPDRRLIYVGSRQGKVWVIPAPPVDLAE